MVHFLMQNENINQKKGLSLFKLSTYLSVYQYASRHSERLELKVFENMIWRSQFWKLENISGQYVEEKKSVSKLFTNC
jgi:hypothetical protein